MTIRVSICTSVLNQSELLRRQIESVRAQTFSDWEQIIVDDGSTEDIKAVVDSFNDARLIYVRFPENKGFQAGYNHAASLAVGDYLELLAADEFLWNRKLEVQVEWMDRHPEIGCTWGLPTPNVGAPWELGERPSWEQYAGRAHNRSREAWVRTLMTLDSIPIGGASMLMRRECYLNIGGFDPQFHDVSDLEIFVKFFQKYDGWVLPYRFADATHPNNRQSSPNEERFADNMNRLRAKHKVSLPPSKGLVTVGIPVYNMARFIGATLESLGKQTFQEFFIKILDDGSTDDLAGVLAPYTDLGIELLRFDENRGVHAAVNQLIARTETEFFVSLAADDTLDPTYLEKVLAEFKADPWLEFVASQTDFIDEAGEPIKPNTIDLQKIPQATNRPREHWLEILKGGNHYFGVGMYRTEALRSLAGLNETDGVLTDYDLYLRLLHRENIKIVQEPLTHTRFHPQMASVGKFTHQWLKSKYHEIKSRYFAPRMKVIIATPFYEMRGFSPYIASLAGTVKVLTQHDIDHEFWELSGDSYVDRAKNTLFNKFLEDPAATDIIMIDSDMQWDLQGFVNVLQMPEEIVMGSYPQKNAWTVWTARPVLVDNGQGGMSPVGRMMGDGSAALKAEYLAGGFLRIKRSALEKYKAAYPDYIYYDQGADPSCPDRLYTEFFCCERAKNDEGIWLRWGEDRVFGKRMRAIGVEAWICPNINFGHYGVKGWMGNYDQFLRNPPQEQAA